MNKIITVPLLGLLVVVLIAALGLLATKTWNPGWNPFDKTADLIIEKAIIKTAQADSFRMEAKINGEFQGKEDAQGIKALTAEISFSEIVDKKDEKDARASFDLSLNVGLEGLILIVKGEIVSAAKDIYLKIKSLPSLPILSLDLEEIRNQWFKIERETSQTESFDEKSFAEDIEDILEENEIFDIKKDFGQEELDGQTTNHYLVELKKDKLKELVPEILEITKKYLSQDEKEEYEKGKEAFLKDFSDNFDDLWDRIKPLEFECWVGTGDSRIKKIKFEKEMVYGVAGEENEGNLKIGGEFTFFDFNKKFEIEIPEDYKAIEEILTEILGGITE